MGSSKSKPTSPRGAFALFPKLPQEIQSQIWTHATVDWAVEQLPYMTSPPTGNDKTVFFIYIDSTIRRPCTHTPQDKMPCYTFGTDASPRNCERSELPPLLAVSHEARAVMYDKLLSICRPEVPIPRGENIYMFIQWDSQSKNTYKAADYGWRIQDMRYPRLDRRIKAERERLKEMQAELNELVGLGVGGRFGSPWEQVPGSQDVENPVFTRQKPDGWVRLPLFYDVKYYRVGHAEDWGNKLFIPTCSGL